MNVSYEWLRAFVPFTETPARIRDLITARVATVDDVVPLRADLAPIVVARVVEAGHHPDSDHLWVTKVDAGTGELLDVVCGAPNVTVGTLYPFAPTGTVMPNGLKIERRKIRGAVSNGMLCSPRELGLGEEHEGIMALDVEVPPGTPLLRAMPIGDTRIVVDVSPNRPDLLSHLGVAREVAAAVDGALALPRIAGAESALPAPARARHGGRIAGIDVRVDDDAGVRRYMAAVMRGVTVGPSPAWLVERLTSVGSRSINNVVDATNYVLHELGQPVHAFDLARLGGKAVIVRRANANEKMLTLDGVERTLDPSMTVIADAERAQAVAGVMGGHDSEVGQGTTDLFIEVASFDPAATRATRRRLGLGTDASYRFERGVDPALAPQALARVTGVIAAVAGGRVDDVPLDVYAADSPPRTLVLRVPRLAAVLGERVRGDEAASLLRSIGFEATAGASDTLRVVIPSWRTDVLQEIDLVEEVARLRGYDTFPSDIRPFRSSAVPDDPQWLVARRVREALVSAGLLEARPMPFVSGADEGYVRVLNPLDATEAHLRRDVLESLARRAEYNLSHMQANVRLFEIGNVFEPADGGLPTEEMRAAAIVMGRRQPAHFTDPKSAEFETAMTINEWDAKGLAELVARRAYPGATISTEGDASGAALWTVAANGRKVGVVRHVQLDAPVWAKPAFGVEISLGTVESADVAPAGKHAHGAATATAGLAPAEIRRRFQAMPTTPASELDITLLVPEGVTAAAIEVVIRQASGDILESVQLVDEYAGKNVPAGMRSLNWRLTFRHPERTLSAKEIDGRRGNVLRQLEKSLNVRQRTP